MEKWNDFGFNTQQEFEFPNIVNVSVIRGDCPCRCVHCPVGISSPEARNSQFGNKSMEYALFKKIALEVADYSHSTLRIHGVGEPLQWNSLPEALTLLSALKIKTWLFTCLVTKNIELLDILARSNSIIEVSLNSYERDDFKKSKGIDAFDLVVDNVLFIRNRIIANKLKTRIIASRVESNDPEYDSGFLTFWKKSRLFDDVFIRSYHNYNSLLQERFNKKTNEIFRCLVHWSRFNIDCDGSAVVCFNELFKEKQAPKEMIYGNIREYTITEIWHSEKINQIRKAQTEKDYSLVKFTEKLPCINCASCQPMGNAGIQTSEYQVKEFSKNFK